jgi:glycine dehydrogenase
MNLFEQQRHEFIPRHIGPNETETAAMLKEIGEKSMESLIGKVIPASIRLQNPLETGDPMSEHEYLQHIKEVSLRNKLYKSYIGQGYYDCFTPSVIQRTIFENPGWYTQYTPYQAEISQGRLESLLNFQTMVSDLTGLPIANASLLDEATAAAEAMAMLFHHVNKGEKAEKPLFFVDQNTFPQTVDVLYTRAEPLGIQLVINDYKNEPLNDAYFGALIQYPNAEGAVEDYRSFIERLHGHGAFVVMATDLLALTLLTPPGELGADVAIGSAQRFGVPLGYGGPHAAFFSTKDDFKRGIPGRIIGVSVDAQNNRALRMALQTREQHIKREKATSNICTAQALLANMAAMYAVYHGPEGIKNIAKRVSLLAGTLAAELTEAGYNIINKFFFDTITIRVENSSKIKAIAETRGVNFWYSDDNQRIGIAVDETTSQADVLDIIGIFQETASEDIAAVTFDDEHSYDHIPQELIRKSSYLTHPVFNTHRSETQMMRYIKSLESKDVSLDNSMIPLGSCTMKLNAATELMPLSWAHWAKIHPFVPADQAKGYQYIISELENDLCKITGFAACSLQPNSGAQGEYAGLLAIRNYHIGNGNSNRNVVLIPISAHGTNPASAVMCGMKVVVVKSTTEGYIDVDDLKAKAEQHKDNLSCLMVTYPSTHGVFEDGIKEVCSIIHENGGLVYMDGANMNAQVGLTSPATIGADVCHLNLHKTFAIPHGGGGPGMGPICVTADLAAFLPGHVSGDKLPNVAHRQGAVSAAPFGSASILLISYAYIKMLGSVGLRKATEYAILNANYMRARLQKYYPILYTGANGVAAHEFIVDLRPFKSTSGIEAEDVAKRLMDFGFHAPTLSFPVPGTIMIEPTESEDKAELDRLVEALIVIHEEVKAIEEGKLDKANNPLKNAPHTQAVVCADEWNRPYTRQQAAFPLSFVRHNKFWPAIARINNTYGDRNLICTCEPMESYAE